MQGSVWCSVAGRCVRWVHVAWVVSGVLSEHLEAQVTPWTAIGLELCLHGSLDAVRPALTLATR
jgi:hypothetical protein